MDYLTFLEQDTREDVFREIPEPRYRPPLWTKYNSTLSHSDSSNLVVNGAAESGDLTGWTETSHTFSVVSESVDIFGTYEFKSDSASAGPFPIDPRVSVTMEQVIDVSTYAAYIDAGVQDFAMVAYCHVRYNGVPGSQTSATIYVQFLDASNVILSEYAVNAGDTGVDIDAYSSGHLNATHTAPTTTRKVKIILDTEIYTFDQNGWYDGISIVAKAASTDSITSTYYAPFPDNSTEPNWPVTRVKSDGSFLETKETSISDVASNDSSWFQDFNARRVYVHLADGSDPNDHTMQIYFNMFFCSKTPESKCALIDDDGNLYFPILSTAAFTAIEEKLSTVFYGTAISTTSQSQLLNWLERTDSANGFFDELFLKYLWDDAKVQIYHGDGGQDVAFADEMLIATLLVASCEISDSFFTLSLKDVLKSFAQTVPPRVFTLEDYPNADPNIVGQPIPTFWNKYDNLPCSCIDTTEHIYKVRDGACIDISNVKVNGETASVDSYDLPNGQFKLSVGGDFPDNPTVTCTAFYSINASGVVGTTYPDDLQLFGGFLRDFALNVMNLLPEFVNDAALVQLEADYTAEASIYIGSQEAASNVLQKVARSLFGYVKADSDGAVTARLFDDTTVVPVDFVEREIYDDIKSNFEQVGVYNKVRVSYNEFFPDTNVSQSDHTHRHDALRTPQQSNLYYATASNPIVTYLYSDAQAAPDFDTYLHELADATAIAQLLQQQMSRRPLLLNTTLGARAFQCFAGDNITISRDRGYSLDGTYTATQWKIRSISKNYLSAKATVVLEDFSDITRSSPVVLPPPSTSDISFGEAQKWADQDAASGVAKTHTFNSSKTDIYVAVSYRPDSGSLTKKISELKFNGVALTQKASTDVTGSHTAKAEIWYLASAAAGSHSLSIKFDGDINTFEVAFVPLSGIGSITDTGGTTTSTGSNTIESDPVNVAVGKVFVDCMTLGQLSSSDRFDYAGSGQGVLWKIAGPYSGNYGSTKASKGYGSYKKGTGASTTMKWTTSGSKNPKALAWMVLNP